MGRCVVLDSGTRDQPKRAARRAVSDGGEVGS